MVNIIVLLARLWMNGMRRVRMMCTISVCVMQRLHEPAGVEELLQVGLRRVRGARLAPKAAQPKTYSIRKNVA